METTEVIDRKAFPIDDETELIIEEGHGLITITDGEVEFAYPVDVARRLMTLLGYAIVELEG